VADASGHKEKDDALGFWGMVQDSAVCGRLPSARLLMGQSAHGEAAKATGHVAEGVSAGDIHGKEKRLGGAVIFSGGSYRIDGSASSVP